MLSQTVRDFEAAHQKDDLPRVQDYLPTEANVQDRPALLAELVRLDLRYRRQRGLPIRAEDYLTPLPELASDERLLIEVMEADWRCRQARGEPATVDCIAQRFPTLPPRVAAHLSGLTMSFGDAVTTNTSAAPQFPEVPGYEVLAVLGEGGMGIVYQVRHTSLDRIVALKMIKGGSQISADDLQRFRTEAEAVARLPHPNIVQIYEVGTCGGLPYFTLEYCAGGSLARKLDSSPVPPSEAARLTETLARAMAAAHRKHIIHRDLKPHNVLLSAEGTVKIADFGLAKKLDTGAQQTQSGAIVGTPSYMAPEQARGDLKAVGPLADVYALGAILYEMLTGRPPFKEATVLDTVMKVLSADPVSPRRWQPKVPRDLETICLKALEKEPARRYANAQELAEDLHRFQNHLPILARRTGLVSRAGKWVRRHPAVAGLLVCLLTALMVAGGFAYQAHLTEQQRQTADDLAHHTEQQRLAEKRRNAVERAELAAMGGDLDKAKEALDEAEQLGLSSLQMHLLRGQIAYHTGEMKEAIQQFTKAVALQPRSVAAHALLAAAYLEVDDWSKQDEALKQALRLEPATPEDYLALGKAQSWHEPETALKNLTLALQKRPSAIARLAHAEVLSSLARDRGDAAQAEQAAREADFVKQLLPDNPVARKVALDARTVAIYAYAAPAHKSQRDQTIALARLDAEALKKFPQYSYSLQMRFQFHRALGEQALLLEELSKSSRKEDYLLTFYQIGEFQKARAAVVKTMPLMYACLALCEFPDGRLAALKWYQELAKDPSLSSWEKLTNQMVPLLLGRADVSRATCLDYRKQKITSPLLDAEMQRALAYLIGELRAADYLKSAGKSRVDQTNAHFFIGLTHLTRGERQQARDHFQKGVETGGFNFNHFEFCWALLSRLERDPTWPPWIPPKK